MNDGDFMFEALGLVLKGARTAEQLRPCETARFGQTNRVSQSTTTKDTKTGHTNQALFTHIDVGRQGLHYFFPILCLHDIKHGALPRGTYSSEGSRCSKAFTTGQSHDPLRRIPQYIANLF
jgi:hypothetical protein